MKGSRDFWHEFHGRGMNVEKLADMLMSSRCHVTKVLNGSIPGSQTKKKILKFGLLTEREVTFLGWEVPHGTKFYVEQIGAGAVYADPPPSTQPVLPIFEL